MMDSALQPVRVQLVTRNLDSEEQIFHVNLQKGKGKGKNKGRGGKSIHWIHG